MANLSIEEPYAVMPARTGLWEPRDGNDPGPPGPERFRLLSNCREKRSFFGPISAPAKKRGILRASVCQKLMSSIKVPSNVEIGDE